MRPELIPAAVEEQLRFVSPTQGLYRTALVSYDVDGHTIPAGARVLLLYAAANRDPRHYPDPDTFRTDREPTDHLAFGSGIITAWARTSQSSRLVVFSTNWSGESGASSSTGLTRGLAIPISAA